jgi:hypothetical protein
MHEKARCNMRSQLQYLTISVPKTNWIGCWVNTKATLEVGLQINHKEIQTKKKFIFFYFNKI